MFMSKTFKIEYVVKGSVKISEDIYQEICEESGIPFTTPSERAEAVKSIEEDSGFEGLQDSISSNGKVEITSVTEVD